MRRLLLFLFSHRLLALSRWDIHFMRLRARNALTGQNRRIAKAVQGRRRPLFLNLGSGSRGIDDGHWVNIDGFADTNVHFLLDFSRRLPFAAGTFDGVFCEHVLEHFEIEGGEAIAREIHRVLKPGGRFRVIVPDAELVLRRYIEEPQSLVAYRGGGTAMEAVNSFFRQRYEHQFLYDFETMRQMLLSAGFAEVARSTFGRSAVAELALDDAKYEWESLYVEAVKG